MKCKTNNMQVYKKVEGLDKCQCGYQPDTVCIGYGRTPYDVWCPECSKQTNTYKQIGGAVDNAIKFWNEIAPLIELRENGNLVYEYENKQYVHEQMRMVLLNSYENGRYNIPVYTLFKNGKIETDSRQFLNKYD
jgi:hypothetical protein